MFKRGSGNKKQADPFQNRLFVVAGARHTLYGKNPNETVPFENYGKLSTSSFLLAKTMPTLISILEPDDPQFASLLRLHPIGGHFTMVPHLQVALITEITLD
jgi:hypothetical protein